MARDVRVEMLYYDLWLFSHFSASGQQILEKEKEKEEEQRPLKRESADADVDDEGSDD